MRQLVHPGPISAARTHVVADTPHRLRFLLQPGDTVEAGIAKGFAAAGCRGGVIAFGGGRCEPFQFVIPAASKDGVHAAWYSDVIAPNGPVELVQCVASVGERDDEPFVHCHGSWRTTEGLRMGHMLAANCIVTEPVEASGFGFVDATFRAIADAETHFTLFEPFAASPSAPTGQALLVRIRPNEDVCTAIESVCRSHHIDSARIFGIGSLNEVHFADGRRMNSHATELFVREGRVTTDERKLKARVDIAVVDMKGNIAEGEILRGDNPVCVTFELVIVPDVDIP